MKNQKEEEKQQQNREKCHHHTDFHYCIVILYRLSIIFKLRSYCGTILKQSRPHNVSQNIWFFVCVDWEIYHFPFGTKISSHQLPHFLPKKEQEITSHLLNYFDRFKRALLLFLGKSKSFRKVSHD